MVKTFGEFVEAVRGQANKAFGVTEDFYALSNLDLLRQWIELNRDVIIKYWHGDIEDTSDTFAAIKPLTG